jgi:hypothetical protein
MVGRTVARDLPAGERSAISTGRILPVASPSSLVPRPEVG